MDYYQLWDSVANIMSITDSLESQVLFGERITSAPQPPYKHQAPSQLLYKDHQWHGYPGIIHNPKLVFIRHYLTPNVVVCSHSAQLEPLGLPVPYGSPLHIDTLGHVHIPEEIRTCIPLPLKVTIRLDHVRPLSRVFCYDSLCLHAYRCLGYPYVWGGRCLHKSLPSAGVDCSGLIQLLYQTQGLHIPRNSMDQYRVCTPVGSFLQLPKGGLVFLHPADRPAINHVLVKVDDRHLIHAAESMGKVVLLHLGHDGEFHHDTFQLPSCHGKVFFGIPANKKAFF